MSGYVLVTILVLVMATWSAFNYVRFSGELNAMIVQNYRSVLASSNMVAALERQDSWALLLLSGDQASQPLYEQSRADFLGWLARAEDNVTLPGEGELIDRIREGYLSYTQALSALFAETAAAPLSIEAGATARAYRVRVLPAFETARAECQELLRINDAAMRTVQGRTTAATVRAAWTIGGVALSTLIAAIILGFTVSDLIARPVRQLADSVRRIGEGRLDEPIAVHSEDEVGHLARAFRLMVSRLRELRASDIAQVIASQSKLASVIDAISDGIVVTADDYTVELVNPVAERVLSVIEESVVGRALTDIVHDPRVIDLLQSQSDDRGQPDEPVLVDMRDRDDRRRYYLAETTPVRHGGELLGRVLLLRDVTAAEEGERVKSQFMSAASHELRTPLTSLTMGVGLLSESKVIREHERERELVDILKEDARRLARLADELFEISVLEKGRLPLNFGRWDVRELINIAMIPFISQAETAGIDLSAQLPEDVTPVRADQEKLTWVVSNLIGNALRYTGAGGKITVSAETHADKVYISVADTGTGIPRDRQEAIFQPYVQLGQAKGGAGLGLAISRDLVKAHGGRIWVESEPGKGSKFTFSVPAEDV